MVLLFVNKIECFFFFFFRLICIDAFIMMTNAIAFCVLAGAFTNKVVNILLHYFYKKNQYHCKGQSL